VQEQTCQSTFASTSPELPRADTIRQDESMSKTAHLRRFRALAGLLLAIGGWCLADLLTAQAAAAQTLIGVHGDRLRLMLGFHVKPEAVQVRLPSPWQLHPPASGPLKGANFFVVLVDRVRDDDAEGKPKSSGTDWIINFVAPARHPQTGELASVIMGGWASTPTNVPGFYQVYRAAAVRMEHELKSYGGDAEEATDIWEVQDASGAGGMELRLRSLRKVGRRTRAKGETHVISAKNPDLWQIHKFEGATDVVRSVPEGIDEVQHYTFRLTTPEYGELFDGSEELIGITVTPWYVRQVLVR
jgi:hypothetical protein